MKNRKQSFLTTFFLLANAFAFTSIILPTAGFVSEATLLNATRKDPPLTVEQIEKLIKVPTPDLALAGEIQERGIDFSVDETILKRLISLGAGPKTIKALKESNTRLRVSIFPYDTCGKYQKRFEGVLSADFRELAFRFRDKKDMSNYVAELRVVPEDKPSSTMTLAEVQNHWKQQSHSKFY
jgi:hypothetical protein